MTGFLWVPIWPLYMASPTLSLCPSTGSFFPSLKPSDLVFKVIFWLGYFNSCINPFIYPCSSKEFQRAFTRLLRCQCSRRRRVLRRFYDQRWRTAVKGHPHPGMGGISLGTMDSMCSARVDDYSSEYAIHHESCDSSHYYQGANGRSLSFKRWRLFPPLRKSSLHLKEKMNNLSNRIKGAPGGKGCVTAPALARTEIDTVSMGIYNDVAEQNSFQIYDLKECYGLKETDI
ncbi:hypothetical protein DPEC_G00188740 [Dallia pectoralis]|uniref:Uncharacterized protein n=1 Tax=Dallia pectoralis TaxID=75939 RepID=A0ACC2GC94_DALPE|nr:hypothetical protein DPEC_G00188740 [Dallia pectoralis]